MERLRIVSPLLVQADDDDDAEIAWVYDRGIVLDDTDGSVLLTGAPPDGESVTEVPCAGDIDGDGRTELVAASSTAVWAWSLDGDVLWLSPFNDSGTFTGCSVFDFDGDGAAEVVMQGETSVSVLDGRTGETVWSDDEHQSGTWGEIPVLVDVDGDGSSELVAPSYNVYNLERGAEVVYGSPSGEWSPGSTMWASADWSGTQVRPDGSIPRYPERPWLTTGIWHGQPSQSTFGADLGVAITDACVDACTGGTAHLAVQVTNLGPEGAGADTPVNLYALAPDGSRTLLQSSTIGTLLWPGESAAGWEITLPVTEVLGGVVVVAGTPGEIGPTVTPDCDETNNEATWTPHCPP